MRLLLAAILLITTALAAQAERRVALVFGTDRYAQLRPLQNARSDADLIASTLEALDFEVTQEPDRDLRRMRRALDDLRDGGPADVALVYFAGHGIEVSGSNRLLPTDADLASIAALEASSLPLDEIRAAATEIAPVVLILIDACRNDPFGGGTGEGRGAFTLGEDVRPGFGRMGEAQDTLFAFAAAPGATAADGEGANSPFTTALAKYLGTEGIEVRSALTLVQQEVYDLTRGAQQPYVESGLPRLFFAAATPGELPERERLLLAMAGLTPALRAEVEAAAARHGVPLAPLYGALIGADLSDQTQSQRAKALDEAATAFLSTSAALRGLEATDPEVAALRQAAEDRLALGDFGGATQFLDQAAARDRAAGTALEDRLVERRLSEAATLRLKSGVLRTALDHPGALAAMEQAAAVHASIEGLQLSNEARAERDDLLWELGDLYFITGQSDRAREAFARLGQAALMFYNASGGSDQAYRDIALSWRLTGNVLVAQGDLAGAQAAYDQALAIESHLARTSGDLERRRDMAATLSAQGYTRRTQGDIPGALASFRQALEIRKAIVAEYPGDNQLLRDMVITQGSIADMLRESGQHAAALAQYIENHSIAERIAAAASDNTDAQLDLAIVRQRIGDELTDAGDFDNAVGYHRASAYGLEQLVARDPANTDWQGALGYARLKTGDALFSKNDLPAALAEYNAGLGIVTRLTDLDPSNAEWQRDLSVARSQIGNVQAKMGQIPQAEQTFLAVQRILVALVNRDPGNVDWRRDYAINLHRLGDLRLQLNDRPGAVAYFRAAFTEVSALAARNPDNGMWQADLVFAHAKLAMAGDDARRNILAGLAIAQELERKGLIAGRDSGMVAELQRMLAATP